MVISIDGHVLRSVYNSWYYLREATVTRLWTKSFTVCYCRGARILMVLGQYSVNPKGRCRPDLQELGIW